MAFDALELRGLGDGPLQRLDARIKLLATIGFVVAVVATPLGSLRMIGLEALGLAMVAGLSGVPGGELARRWLALAPVVGFLALMVGLSHPARASLGLPTVVGSIAAKNAIAITAMLVLANVTPFPRILSALRRLGAPAVLVANLHFMYRYLHVLVEERDRMALSRRARTFRRSGLLDWRLSTGLIGLLFLRAMERGERVHAAMLARGWDGTIRTLDGPEGD